LIKIYPDNIVKHEENNRKERKDMAKIMKIEGMMCGHCEARVKKTLEGIEGVKEAIVDHTTDSAKVIFSQEVNEDVLVNAVEAQDYKVISIEDAE
jgi:Cu2+-exporting ATPase